MYAADQIIDIGPGAGEHGGNVVAQGELLKSSSSQSNQLPVSILADANLFLYRKKRRSNDGRFIEIKGARQIILRTSM